MPNISVSAGKEKSRASMSLAGMRVLDLSNNVAGSYCTKLLVDGGADVLKIEPASGDPLRTWTAHGPTHTDGDGALFQYLSASKRSKVGTWDEILDLAPAADVVVEDLGPGRVDIAALRERCPRVVVVSISPFGHYGPRAYQPATEFTLQ